MEKFPPIFLGGLRILIIGSRFILTIFVGMTLGLEDAGRLTVWSTIIYLLSHIIGYECGSTIARTMGSRGIGLTVTDTKIIFRQVLGLSTMIALALFLADPEGVPWVLLLLICATDSFLNESRKALLASSELIKSTFVDLVRAPIWIVFYLVLSYFFESSNSLSVVLSLWLISNVIAVLLIYYFAIKNELKYQNHAIVTSSNNKWYIATPILINSTAILAIELGVRPMVALELGYSEAAIYSILSTPYVIIPMLLWNAITSRKLGQIYRKASEDRDLLRAVLWEDYLRCQGWGVILALAITCVIFLSVYLIPALVEFRRWDLILGLSMFPLLSITLQSGCFYHHVIEKDLLTTVPLLCSANLLFFCFYYIEIDTLLEAVFFHYLIYLVAIGMLVASFLFRRESVAE